MYAKKKKTHNTVNFSERVVNLQFMMSIFQVHLEFSEPEVEPGSETTLKVSAENGSLCGIGIVDKSVYVLGGENKLTPKKVKGQRTLHENTFIPFHHAIISSRLVQRLQRIPCSYDYLNILGFVSDMKYNKFNRILSELV